jgi:Down syndrome cell adhesion protein 1
LVPSLCYLYPIYVFLPPLVPSSPPFNVSTNNLTSAHKIQVTWSPAPSGKHNGQVLGHHIRARPLTTSNTKLVDSRERTFTVLTPRDRTELTGLESFTLYSIQAAAFTSIGDGPYSDPVYAGTFINVRQTDDSLTTVSDMSMSVRTNGAVWS